jgi:dTDP-4-dehydrorhamnose reductase
MTGEDMVADGTASRGPTGGRVLVTGAAGMLGSQCLLDVPAGFEAVGADLRPAPEGHPPVDLVGHDLTEEDAVEQLFEEAGPLAGVLHPDAYTAVDRAEEEPELAERVNVLAPGLVARAAKRRGIPMVLVSTDFVFDGTRRIPYLPEDQPAPTSVYGRTKLSGEQAALEAHPDMVAIVRTQWLYGPRGSHFPGTMLRLSAERDSLTVVDDQFGSPTSTLEVAPALWDVLRLWPHGTWHAACEGEASWYDLAVETLRLAGRTTAVARCTSAEFPRPAARPAYSVLDSTRLTQLRGKPLAPWTTALRTFLELEGLLLLP